mgnify:CR=1 FL=1
MENFIQIECCTCGMLFAVSKTLNSNWRDSKKDFYCPNGHSMSYTENLTQNLQKRLVEKINDYNKEISLNTKLQKQNEKLERQIKKLKKPKNPNK